MANSDRDHVMITMYLIISIGQEKSRDNENQQEQHAFGIPMLLFIV